MSNHNVLNQQGFQANSTKKRSPRLANTALFLQGLIGFVFCAFVVVGTVRCSSPVLQPSDGNLSTDGGGNSEILIEETPESQHNNQHKEDGVPDPVEQADQSLSTESSASEEPESADSSSDMEKDAMKNTPSDEKVATENFSPVSCQGLQALSGEQKWKLKHDGVERSFAVDIPPQYDPTKPMPLILNFHGLSSNGWQQKLLSKMTDLGKKEGFLVVYPEGRGIPQSWNAGKCCAPANSLLQAKDVDFVNELLNELERKLCIDKRRIFATGMSNGAFMTYRLACELSDRIAAFSPVAGSLIIQPCQPKRPIPLLGFNGTSDTLVPYPGSALLGFPSVEETFRFWAKHNGCGETPDRTYDKGDTYCNTFRQCKDGVTLTTCVVKNGGHTWPGGFPIPAMGKTTQDIDASETMWEFFKKHPLP